MMIDEVKTALLEVSKVSAAQKHLPRLDNIILELNVTQSKKIGGKVNLFIVTFGADKNKGLTNTIKITLQPPSYSEGDALPVSSLGMSEALADSILAAAYAIEAASRGLPKLEAKEVVSKIMFVITVNGEGGIGIEFPPFDLEFGGGASTKAVQSITVTYKVS